MLILRGEPGDYLLSRTYKVFLLIWVILEKNRKSALKLSNEILIDSV